MDRNALLVGFGMALAQNEDAMKKFASMSEEQRNDVLMQTRQVRSRQEMERLVSRLGHGAQAED